VILCPSKQHATLHCLWSLLSALLRADDTLQLFPHDATASYPSEYCGAFELCAESSPYMIMGG
jgi:hypothetical protein